MANPRDTDNTRITQAARGLLPQGKATAGAREDGGNLRKIVDSIGEALAVRNKAEIVDMLNQCNPAYISNDSAMREWEAVCGILTDDSRSIEARRQAVQAVLTATGGNTIAYLREIFCSVTLGYEECAVIDDSADLSTAATVDDGERVLWARRFGWQQDDDVVSVSNNEVNQFANDWISQGSPPTRKFSDELWWLSSNHTQYIEQPLPDVPIGGTVGVCCWIYTSVKNALSTPFSFNTQNGSANLPLSELATVAFSTDAGGRFDVFVGSSYQQTNLEYSTATWHLLRMSIHRVSASAVIIAYGVDNNIAGQVNINNNATFPSWIRIGAGLFNPQFTNWDGLIKHGVVWVTDGNPNISHITPYSFVQHEDGNLRVGWKHEDASADYQRYWKHYRTSDFHRVGWKNERLANQSEWENVGEVAQASIGGGGRLEWEDNDSDHQYLAIDLEDMAVGESYVVMAEAQRGNDATYPYYFSFNTGVANSDSTHFVGLVWAGTDRVDLFTGSNAEAIVSNTGAATAEYRAALSITRTGNSSWSAKAAVKGIDEDSEDVSGTGTNNSFTRTPTHMFVGGNTLGAVDSWDNWIRKVVLFKISGEPTEAELLSLVVEGYGQILSAPTDDNDSRYILSRVGQARTADENQVEEIKLFRIGEGRIGDHICNYPAIMYNIAADNANARHIGTLNHYAKTDLKPALQNPFITKD